MGRKRKGNHKRKHNTGHKPPRDRLTEAERDAIGWCGDRGLYLLVVGTGRTRHWVVYRRKDGSEVGIYWPCTGRYQRGKWTGLNVWEWRDALDRIVYRPFPD